MAEAALHDFVQSASLDRAIKPLHAFFVVTSANAIEVDFDYISKVEA